MKKPKNKKQSEGKKEANKMQLYREKKAIWKLFTKSKIHSIIAPFGIIVPYKNFQFRKKCRIICMPWRAKHCNNKNTEIRTMSAIHAKIAIGQKGVIFGSFNFSTKSKRIELIAYFDQTDEILKFQNKFDYWWAKATPVKP
jgi:phosphatidylserine/phosphatidylglycerophosphate/cardiolipin synthase-like enzyme